MFPFGAHTYLISWDWSLMRLLFSQARTTLDIFSLPARMSERRALGPTYWDKSTNLKAPISVIPLLETFKLWRQLFPEKYSQRYLAPLSPSKLSDRSRSLICDPCSSLFLRRLNIDASILLSRSESRSSTSWSSYSAAFFNLSVCKEDLRSKMSSWPECITWLSLLAVFLGLYRLLIEAASFGFIWFCIN